MTDQPIQRPDAHERDVAEKEAEQTGRDPGAMDDVSGSRVAGTGDQEDYEDEIEAERKGTTGDEVEREKAGDERTGEAARWFTG